MEYSALTCPYCGARFPPGCKDKTFVCDYCGHTIVLDDIKYGQAGFSDKAVLIVEYDAGNSGINVPDLHVIVSKKNEGIVKKALFGSYHNDKGELYDHKVPNRRKLKLELDKGEYNVLFKINIYKNRTTIVLNEEKYVKITWNRLTGKVCLSYDKPPGELI